MQNVLKWSVKYWEKNLKSLKECFQKNENVIFQNIPLFTERLNTDLEDRYISDYSGLSLSYGLCAKNYFVLKKDVINCKKYFYLAAKAEEMCCLLYEKGLYAQNDIARTIKNRGFWLDVFYAFLAGDEKLALNLTSKGSFLESMISGNYDESKEFMEKKMDGEDDFKVYSLLWDIAVMDEAALTKDLSKRIKEIRKWYSLNFSYIDVYGLWVLKLARRRGMSCGIHVAELPEELLEDTPIDYEHWKMPREEEMHEILRR